MDISTSRYSGGLVSYLDVVTAQARSARQRAATSHYSGAAVSFERAIGEGPRRRLGRIQPGGRAGQSQTERHHHASKLHLQRTSHAALCSGVANHFSEDSLAAMAEDNV